MENKHSGLGIASFIISTVVCALTFILLMVAGAIEVSTPGGMDENSVEAVIIGMLFIGFMLLELLAAGLAIAGLCQKNRLKIFSILGLVFSIFSLVGGLTVLMIGLSAG